MIVATREALDAAEALLTELAVTVAEQDLLSDDEYDPELDTDPTDAEYALDYGDTNENLNNLPAAAYAINAGMPVIRWKLARKLARERQQAKKAARQFHNYALAQYALYVTGQIDLGMLNERVMNSFRRQARNAFVAGRRTMGLMQAASGEDEATLQLMLGVDESALDAYTQNTDQEHMGIVGRANEYFNQFQNAQMAKDWSEKLVRHDTERGIKDAARDFGPKAAVLAGVVGADKLDQMVSYQDGWDQLNSKLGRFDNQIENYASAGELNAMGGLPGDTVLVWWQLGSADHCSDCISLSDASPLYLSALDEEGIFPGSGHTQCGGNCHCELGYEVPDQVCGDGLGPEAGEPDLALTESGEGKRLNVFIQEADSCANPVDIASMDVADAQNLDEESAYSWDEDIQNTFEGDIGDSVDFGDLAGAAQAGDVFAKDLARLFDFMNALVPPDVLPELRVTELHDAATRYHYVWHEAADAIHFHAGLVSGGPMALEHEFTLRAMNQLAALAKEKGKALVIDGKTAGPGLRKWLDTLGAEHKVTGATLPSVSMKWPTSWKPPATPYVIPRISIGVSRARPEMGGAVSLADVEKLRANPVIHDAEATTSADLKALGVRVDGQDQVIGRWTDEAGIGGGEPSLQVELDATKVDLRDIDIANAYLVRRNLQDATITTITGDVKERLGLANNGYLLRVTGLPVKKMDEVYAAVGKIVPLASIDTTHGVVEFSVFEKDVTPQLKIAFTDLAKSFPGAKLDIEDAHIRWYFHDEAQKLATDYIHGPAADLLTADDVIAAYPTDLRIKAIAGNRSIAGVEPVAGGVEGTLAAAVPGYGLGRPQEALAKLLAQPLVDAANYDPDATEALAKAYQKSFADWAKNLSADEKKGLAEYQKGTSDALNNWLRKGQPDNEATKLVATMAKEQGVLAYDQLRDAMDSAISKGQLPNPLLATNLKEPTLVFRGVIGEFKAPRVGDLLADKAYVSTSLDPVQGVEFASFSKHLDEKVTQTLYRYALPEGHPAAYVDGFFTKNQLYAEEREVLLPRNEPFRVVNVTPDVKVKNPDGFFYPMTVVDLVPESAIEYRSSEAWLKTQLPHFMPPPVKELVLEEKGAKLGGLTQKAIFTDPDGNRFLFKPKKVFINDEGLSLDAANVEKTTDYIADALKLDVKPVEPYTAPFPFKDGAKMTGGNVQKLVEGVKPITANAPEGAAPAEVIDALTATQTSQMAQHQIFDWLVGNDDGHIGQWLIDAHGDIIGIDKDAAIWELPAQYVLGKNTMDDGGGFARSIFDHVSTERLAKLDPEAIATLLDRVDAITDAQYIAMFRPVIPVLMAHPNAVKLDEAGWISNILRRKHELRHDVDTYYAHHIGDAVRAGIELPEPWAEWRTAGAHFPAVTDVKSAVHLAAIEPAIELPPVRADGVGLKPLNPQTYVVPGSPVPLNAPLPAWSGFVPEEPPLPKLQATAEELAQAKADAHAVYRTVQGVVDGTYTVGISFTPADSLLAEQHGFAYAKLGGVRVYGRTEADLAPLKDYLAVKGHSSFDREFDHLLGYSDEDIAKLDAYDAAKKGLSLRAGAVVVEPDGRMWVLAPNNKYAGYSHTWTKGGVEGTETTGAAAVRELREETGLGVELDSFLGDYTNSDGTAVSRMYLAHRVGGGPLYAAPKETYKIKLMTAKQAERNLLRFGKPDARDQAVLHDALLKLNGSAGDVSYVIPPDDVGQFHAKIALVKDVTVPSVEPSVVPAISFAANPVTIPAKAAGGAFAFDPGKVADLMGTEKDYPGSSKTFPFNTTKWQVSPADAQKMFWKAEPGGIIWANAKAQLPDPFMRMTVHMAQLRKFGEMIAADPALTHLALSNALLDQVPRLKELVASVGGYSAGAKQSVLARPQIAKLLEATKGGATVKAGVAKAIPTAAIDPSAKIVGRSGVATDALADAVATVKETPGLPPVPVPPTLEELTSLDIGERKATFKALPLEQRDELSNAVVSVPARIAELTKPLGEWVTKNNPVFDVLTRDEVLKATGLVTASARFAIRDYTTQLADVLLAAGVTDPELRRALLHQSYDAMVANEIETMGQVLGDHGVRHTVGDAQMAWKALQVVPGNDTPLQHALLMLAASFHDTGYLTPTGRAFLTSDHPRSSMQAFNAIYRSNIDNAFGKKAADDMARIIETHDTSELDWANDPVGSSFRLSDNLALFEKEKLPALIAYVPGNDKVLIDLAEGKISVGTARGQMQVNIAAAIPDGNNPVRIALNRAVEGVGPTLPKFTIGMFGGSVGDIRWVDDHVAVDLVRGKTNEALSKLVDAGQEQFAKFATSYGIDGKAFVDDGTFTFKSPDGKVVLTASVVTPKGVLVDASDLKAVTSPEAVDVAAALGVVKETGPPGGTTTLAWKLPGKALDAETIVIRGPSGDLIVGGSIKGLDAKDQLTVVAATLAKMDLGEAHTVNLFVSILGSEDTKAWLTDTFGAEALLKPFPAQKIVAWREGLKADLVDHHIDPAILKPVEAAEAVGHGPSVGPLAAQFGLKPDTIAGFTTTGDVPFTEGVRRIEFKNGNAVVDMRFSRDGEMLHVTNPGLAESPPYLLSAHQSGAVRMLHWLGDYTEAHPGIEVVTLNKAFIGWAGAPVRDLIASFTDQLGVPGITDFALPRSTIIAIRDALAKEITITKAIEPVPEAGLGALFGKIAPAAVEPSGIDWHLFQDGEQTGSVFHDTGFSIRYKPVINVDAVRQLADIVAMGPLATEENVLFFTLNPTVADILSLNGAHPWAGGQLIKRAEFKAFVEKLTAPSTLVEPALSTTLVLPLLSPSTKAYITVGLGLTPAKTELLPEYKAYAAKEIQLRKTTYGSWGGVIWRRWGNRIEAWEPGAAIQAQVAFLVQSAQSMDEFAKIDYLRVLKPDELAPSVKALLDAAGGKAYAGGYRIERADLLKLRDQMQTDFVAAAAEPPKVLPFFDKYAPGVKPADVNALFIDVTAPDKYKFSWATYSQNGLSAKIVTRTSKSELWWRRVIEGPASSGATTQQAVLREWVRQADEFAKHPEWKRMRITGLNKLTVGMVAAIKDAGAEVIDADTLHLSREKVIAFGDAIRADLGQKVTAPVAVLEGAKPTVFDLLHASPALTITYETKPPPAGLVSWIANFTLGHAQITYEAAKGGQGIRILGFIPGPASAMDQGASVVSFLKPITANSLSSGFRMRSQFLAYFPEFRDALEKAGAQWDNGDLVLDGKVTGLLHDALWNGADLPEIEVIVSPAESGVKLSAQLGYDKSYLDALPSTVEKLPGYGDQWFVGNGHVHAILTTEGQSIVVEPWSGTAVVTSPILPLSQIVGLSHAFEPAGALAAGEMGVKFTASWLTWAGPKARDAISAAGGVASGDGGLFMHKLYLSKLAAKIEDDVGIDNPLLGSAAEAVPLKVIPQIAGPGDDVPILAQWIDKHTTTGEALGSFRTTHFTDGPEYDWNYAPNSTFPHVLTITNFHGVPLSATPTEMRSGMVGLMRQFGQIAEAKPGIEQVVIETKALGSLQTEWLKAWGAKPLLDYPYKLGMERADLLALNDAIEKQLMGMAVPTAPVMAPGLGAILGKLKVTADDVSAASATWLDAVTESLPSGATHVSSVGGTEIGWSFDKLSMGNRITWYSASSSASEAAKAAALRHLLSTMEADAATTRLLISAGAVGALGPGFQEMLVTAGAEQIAGGSLRLPREIALKLKATLDGIGPVGLGALDTHAVEGAEALAKAAVEAPAFDAKAAKSLSGTSIYSSEVDGQLFPDNVVLQYEGAVPAAWHVPQSDNTVMYKNVSSAVGLGVVTPLTDQASAATHLLAELHNDGSGVFDHDAFVTAEMLKQTGLGSVLLAYGGEAREQGVFMANEALKTLAKAIDDGSITGGVVPGFVKVSVGQKFGFDLLKAVDLSNSGSIGGGKLSRTTTWRLKAVGYASPKMTARWSELKDGLRWDQFAKPDWGITPDMAFIEASGYRQLQLLAKLAGTKGVALSVPDGLLAVHPKIKTLLEGYGAKAKVLVGGAKGLRLDAEGVGHLDSAFEREKAAAILEAKPTGAGFTSGQPLSKQPNFGFDPAKIVMLKQTVKEAPADANAVSIFGEGTLKSVYEGTGGWGGGTQTGTVFYKIGPDPALAGTALSIKGVLAPSYGLDKSALIYHRLNELLNDPAHPIDVLRVKGANVGSGVPQLLKALGATYDETSKEYILNPTQTKLLALSIEEDKVAWDPLTGQTVAGPGFYVKEPLPPVAQVASVPEPVMVQTPVPPVPLATATNVTTLAQAYNWNTVNAQAIVDAMASKDTSVFTSKVLSVGKYGPAVEDEFSYGAGNVKIKWSFDDHKGVRIAHIRQLTGGGGFELYQNSALVAELRGQLVENYFVTHPELARVIIDKKAIATNPGFEKLLKDAGWKETKAYYTTDRAGLTKLADDLKANKASWQTVSALPVGAPPAVPLGAGSAFVMPAAVKSKLAAPSFIYGYDKAAVDSAYGSLIQNGLGVLPSAGGNAQTYELVSGGAKGSWSISPSTKTTGFFDFSPSGNPVADQAAAVAMLRKVAEDAQNRIDKFWVKPDVYDKVPGLRQLLLDAGGSEQSFANLGTAIQMPTKDAAKVVQAISADTMAGLKVTITNPADYLIYDHLAALALFEKAPEITEQATGTIVTWDIHAVGKVEMGYKLGDREVTWDAMTGVGAGSAPLASVAQIEWFNEHGVPSLVITKDVLAQVPKLANFLLASGGVIEKDAIRLDASALNAAAKFLNKEHLPEALGGSKLPYSVMDDMAAKTNSVIEALHAEIVTPEGLAKRSTFEIGGSPVRTEWTASKENIYWRGMSQLAASVGQTRAAAVAQLRSFVTQVAQNANLGRLDVDARVFDTVPHLRDVLAKFGATEEHATDGSVYWSLDRARADKLRVALDTELGEVLVGPPGYAFEQARIIKWPAAEDLKLADPAATAALGGQTRKALFSDAEGNQWMFKPGASGRGAATDAAASELARLLGLATPSVKLYTLNIAGPGEPAKLVQGSLYKMLPNVKPVVLSQMSPMQVQDMLRQSVLDWVIANDDGHANNYLINALDDKLWSIDKTRGWVEFHQAHDVLNRLSEGNLGGTPLIFKYFREAVANPEKLRAIHPSTIAVTLRHLQEISEEDFRRIVEPVTRMPSANPLYRNNPAKLLADMVERKNGTAADFEVFFRTQIKDAIAFDEARVPEEWRSWYKAGGTFDLTITPEDLWKEHMADLDSVFGAEVTVGGTTYPAGYSPEKARALFEQEIFAPIRGQINAYFGGGISDASGQLAKKGWGGEFIIPNLERKGLGDVVKKWEDLNQWAFLHVMSGDKGLYSTTIDDQFRKFWNPETGTIKVTHSTDRWNVAGHADPQTYMDKVNASGLRPMYSTSVGTHTTVGVRAPEWVYYYLDLPYTQVFSSLTSGHGAGGSEAEILARDTRPEQIMAIRHSRSPFDLTKLMNYSGPVVSHAA